ncbi:Protein Hook 3 [Homalodisca vitripennis]|nr:Protein Hook 3 [Homalodisca vitripennis]
MKVELQEKEILELQSKLDSLQQTAGEARLLKDEVDILRETADKVEKYEGTIQSYQKKLEELGDLKRECKVLETKNLSLLEQNVELEKELKKSATWKTQVEVYKKQIAELHSKYNEETKRADKCEFDYKKASEQLKAVKREKESLISERDLLRETNEELRCCQLQQRNVETTPVGQLPENIISVTELTQKVLLLEHENKKLRLNQRTSEDEKLSVVQSLLDDAKQQINQLRLENRHESARPPHSHCSLNGTDRHALLYPLEPIMKSISLLVVIATIQVSVVMYPEPCEVVGGIEDVVRSDHSGSGSDGDPDNDLHQVTAQQTTRRGAQMSVCPLPVEAPCILTERDRQSKLIEVRSTVSAWKQYERERVKRGIDLLLSPQ